MTDFPAPEDASPSPETPETVPAAAEPSAPGPRKVYESNLLPDRRGSRVSAWFLIPLLLIGFGAAYYFLLYAPQKRRQIVTAGQIVFASDRNSPGTAHLWTMTPGGAARALTSGSSPDTSPVFSPDGSQLAFLSPRERGQSQVFLVDADGQNMEPLTHTSGTKDLPSFAPSDNHLLAYTAGGILYRADGRTKAVDQIAPVNADPAHPHGGSVDDSQETTPQAQPTTVPGYAWRPGVARDAQGLAAVEDTDGLQTLAILPTPEAALVTTSNGQPGGPPLMAGDAMSLGWSPSGGLLAVAVLGVKGMPAGKGLSALFLFDGQGALVHGAPPVQIPSATVGPENPVFTPDGSTIVFEIWSQPDLATRKCGGLFAANTDASGQPRRIVAGDAEHAAISQDGKTVYYLNARSDGRHDLCSIGLDGSGFQRLSDGVEDVAHFTLSPQ